jgi:hypothetical protein
MSFTLLRSSILITIYSFLAVAQTPAETSQEATMQALLKEVRALRLAIEQSNQIAPRIQIAVARMQAQEERVRNATRHLQEVRDKIADTESKRAKGEQLIKMFESQHDESDLNAFKAEAETLNSLEQQLRVQEADANAQLQREEGLLDEANNTLKAIERSLAERQQ